MPSGSLARSMLLLVLPERLFIRCRKCEVVHDISDVFKDTEASGGTSSSFLNGGAEKAPKNKVLPASATHYLDFPASTS